MYHLHCHSHYSVLDGLARPADIVKKAAEQGAQGVGITDHASISGTLEIMKTCKEHKINPVIGCEFYVVDQVKKPGKGEKEIRYHLTVWAKSWPGVQSIMRQLSLANRQFYYRPRLTVDQIFDFKDCFIGTACCFGILANPDYVSIYSKLVERYGSENTFLEMMPHAVDLDDGLGDRQAEVNNRALGLFKKFGGRFLLTNDNHYIEKADAETHRVLLCAQYNKQLSEFKGWPDWFYMRSVSEMVEAAKIIGLPDPVIRDGILNAKLLSDKVSIERPKIQVSLPSIYVDDKEAFVRIILDGWNSKIEGVVDNIVPYHERMIYELKTIKKMGFERYFLIVHDVISWARESGIMVGPARGSSAGSLVCYLMGIVQVDPLKFGLYFERFLNPERVEMPDIDVDFQDDRREEVFNYIAGKYGQDKTAFINTFGKLSVKSAFRDVARAYGIKYMDANDLAKQVEDESSFDEIGELSNFKASNPDIVSQSVKLDGTIRNVGQHACGIVISDHNLDDVCVLERRKRVGGGETFVTNWDKRESEEFGLLKIDVLGLSTLTMLDHTSRLIFKNHCIEIDFEKIDLEDEKALQLFQRADTIGVFQFEGNGMRGLLKSINPQNFMDVTDCTALYRPGSLQSGQTQKYVDVAKGVAKETYSTELLRPILKSTKGQLVYQEQIMQVFNKLGGFTWAEADQMRKIIGKKLGIDKFNEHKEHFVNGCKSNGVEEQAAIELFDAMAEFASYSFNLSHAVSYTMISWWAAYLKAHYPVEFYAGCLSGIGNEARATEVVQDAKSRGIKILQPDINISTEKYQVDGENIRYPLSAIKGVGDKAVDVVLESRRDGVFNDFDNFQDRINKRSCNKRVVDVLKRAGAFESLGIVEFDKNKREKDFSELIDGYVSLPKFQLQNLAVDREAVLNIAESVRECANLKATKQILPNFEDPFLPNIMIINSKVKGANHLFSGKSGGYLLKILKKHGIKKQDVYLTGVNKCERTGKECEACSTEKLKTEIAAVKPALVIVFAPAAIKLFEPKGKMGKLHGQVKYSADLDTYALFSYSPQYAHFQEKTDMFEQAMSMLDQMIEP